MFKEINPMTRFIQASAIILAATGALALGQSYEVDWFTVDDGGGTATGGGYELAGAIGQPDAGVMSGGGGMPTFTERPLGSADSVISVHAADVDGDGDVDILSASNVDNSIRWFDNDGASPPGFTARVITSSATGAASVFAADLDGDLDQDVVWAAQTGDTVAWHENDGGSPPTFTQRTISTAYDSPFSVYAADVNGDGDVDVVAGYAQGNRVVWFDSDGGSPPAFTARTISTQVSLVRYVVAADMDGDTDLDVLAASSGNNSVYLFRNEGGLNPAFTRLTVTSTAATCYVVHAADVDRDGDMDTMAAAYGDNKIAWYESDGASPPVFTERVLTTALTGARTVFPADLDGDGDIDILAGGQTNDTLLWFENDGDGDVVTGLRDADRVVWFEVVRPAVLRLVGGFWAIGRTGAACALPGDMNLDGRRDGLDMQDFVACLLGTGANCVCADLNGSGTPDPNDIPLFVVALVGP